MSATRVDRSLSLRTTCVDVQVLYVLPTQHIYAFRMILHTHYAVFPCNINRLVCSMRALCLYRDAAKLGFKGVTNRKQLQD
jgi:hypothetical protein